MQNEELKKLSDSKLLEKTKCVVAEERRITVDVLLHFQEVEKRKAYGALGYLSLFEYATRELHYSESSAMRRITAMQALKDNPELKEKIEDGSLTVSGVARVQSFLRKEEKISGEKWQKEEKVELFANLENQSQRQIEKTLTEISPEAVVIETVKPIQKNLTELKIFLNDEELSELNRLRGLIGHELKSPESNSELIKKLIKISKEVIEEKKKGKNEGGKNKGSKNEEEANSPLKSTSKTQGHLRTASPTSKMKVSTLQTRYIPEKIKRELFKRANLQCEHPIQNVIFVDQSGKVQKAQEAKRCTSTFKLEIDHIIPYALGGSNQIENLRVVCRAHNQIRTRSL